MAKINISLMSGSSLSKPLITAFKSNNSEYVVLDNEMNGTMGLPIILVSKLVNNTLVAVPDEEWNVVKEALRLIIAGNQVDYINVSETIGAEETFFKQLTLPLASFEALKNNYRPIDASVNPTPAAPETSTVDPGLSQPISSVGPMPQAEPSLATPEVTPVQPEVTPVQPEATPVMPEPVAQVEPTPVTPEPVQPMPQPQPEVVEPVMPSAPVSQNIAEVAMPIAPQVEPVPEVTESVPVDFTADKEAFLKACENMFDALVAKFNK